MTVNRLLSDKYLWDCEDDFFRAYDIAQQFRQRIHQAADTIASRNEVIGQYDHELTNCEEQVKAAEDKVKRRTGWAWVGKVGVGIGALFAVKKLVDEAKP